MTEKGKSAATGGCAGMIKLIATYHDLVFRRRQLCKFKALLWLAEPLQLVLVVGALAGDTLQCLRPGGRCDCPKTHAGIGPQAYPTFQPAAPA